MAKLVLEFDDRSEAGFRELLENLQSTDKSAEVLSSEFTAMQAHVAETTREVEVLRQKLAQTEAERTLAMQAAAKEVGFLGRALEETGAGAARGAGVATEGYVKFRIQVYLAKLAVKSAAKAAAAAMTGMAASAAAAVGPVIAGAAAAKANYDALNFVLSETDRHFAALRNGSTVQFSEQLTDAIREQAGINARNNEELIAQLNAMSNLKEAGFSYEDSLRRLEQAAAASGQSMEDLGVRTASNASRIGDAAAELGDALSEPFGRAELAIKDWWESSSIVRSALDSLENAAASYADGVSSGLRSVRDGWDDLRVKVGGVVGANEEEYRKEIHTLREMEEAQERVAQAQEKAREHFASLKEVNRALEDEAKMRTELARIGELRSNQIDVEIHKVREAAGRAAAAGEFRGKQEQEYTELMQALTRRREEALKEEAKTAAETAKKASEERVKAAKAAADEEEKLRKEAQKAEADFRMQRARGNEELAFQERQGLRDFEMERLKRTEDTEADITRLKKESLRDRANLELQFAKSAAEAERIRWELARDLRQAEFDQVMQVEAKEAAIAKQTAEDKKKAAQEAAQKAIDEERRKIEAIKALTNSQGDNIFGQVVGQQSQRSVLDAITKKRIADSRTENPKRGREAQIRAERAIRASTARDFRSGRIGEGEIQKAQADLAARQILAGNKQGAFSQQTMKAFSEQAKAFMEQARLNEEMTQQAQEFQAFMQQVKGTVKGQQERARAQRRAVRG